MYKLTKILLKSEKKVFNNKLQKSVGSLYLDIWFAREQLRMISWRTQNVNIQQFCMRHMVT